jgi:hypothetical protein
MFPLRPIPTPDYCDRAGCTREPEVLLDATSRLHVHFPRRSVRLCMACLAEAECKLSDREHDARLRRYEQRFGVAAQQRRGREW